MEDSRLHQAHGLATRADKAVIRGDVASAVELYTQAAAAFEETKAQTTDEQALRALELLARKYARIAQELRAAVDADPTLGQRPVGPHALAHTLASARGIPRDGDEGYLSVRRKTSTDEDPFAKFSGALEAALARLQRGLREPAGRAESFYIVPAAAPSDAAEGEVTTSIGGYEPEVRRVRDAAKTALAKLRADLRARDQRRGRELEAELEALRGDNERLRIQNKRLKTRWEGLKESARRRRETEDEPDDER
ncbi:uncharacterized protein V1510DRAFT_392853 [Dipodascopsis tothii]|uniref:uncharacterized protein n=1 Tax=Dipodascopsis tothii TaxID=44089 RepID=UPI0034CF70D9